MHVSLQIKTPYSLLIYLARVDNSIAALKVLRSEDSHPNNTELRILHKVHRLKASFYYLKNQRRYLCMAMEPTGPSINTWLEVPRESLDVQRAIIFIKAFTDKVTFLH